MLGFTPSQDDINSSHLYMWRRPSCLNDTNHDRASLDSYVEEGFLTIGTQSNVLSADVSPTRIVYFGVQLSHLRNIDTGSGTFEVTLADASVTNGFSLSVYT